MLRAIGHQIGVQAQRGRRDLFMPQSHHGIDPHGAPGRDEARQERDRDQQHNRRTKQPGSCTDTSKRSARNSRAVNQLPTKPASAPPRVHRATLRNTSRRMLCGVAPSTMRTPISRVRCATRYATTPNNPTAARQTPINGNSVSKMVLNRGRPANLLTRCAIASRMTGCVGSMLATSERTHLATVSGFMGVLRMTKAWPKYSCGSSFHGM
jgi:hypothetical protein